MQTSRTEIHCLLLFTIISYVQGWCLKTQFRVADKVRSIDYSFDGSMIGVGADGNSLRVYDAYTYNLKHTFSSSGDPLALSFNPLGTYLVSGNHDGTMTFANLLTGASNVANSNHTCVFSIDFSNNSNQMVSCGKDQDIKIWDSSNWPITLSANATGSISNDMRGCVWTADNKIITADSAGVVRILNSPYSLASLFGTARTYGGGANISHISNRYTTYDYTVADGSGSKKGWHSNDTATPVYSVSQSVFATSYAYSLDYFMFGGSQKKVNIYDATTKNLVGSFSTSGTILSADFSTDGKYLAVGDDSDYVYVYSQICNMDCGTLSFLNLTSKACELCSSYMEGCGSCYSSTICAICLQGYYLNTGKTCTYCNSAMRGCGTCNSSSNCTTPLPGYYLTATNLTATCQSIMPGCLICNSSTVCLQCHNEYYQNTTNKCASCNTIATLPYCLKCYNTTYCTQCQMGYYRNTAVANTATCSRCAANCMDCASLTICYECNVGYYTTGGVCLSCSSNCLACNNTNFCFNCITNYFITAAGACTICTSPCLTCVTTATTCLSCYPGYYFDGTSSCLPCSNACSTCTAAATCLTCIDSYYLGGTTCTQCNVTFPNCQTCSSTNCTVCLTSFYYDSTAAPATQCKSCANQMHGCLLCSSSTICLFCAPGHYLSALTGNNSCQPCSLGCTVCQTSSNCTSCAPGYFFSGWTCAQCNPKCGTCTGTATNCLSCTIGFYLQAIGTCQACNATSAYCLACMLDSSSVLQCIQCGVGFYLNSGSCSRCGSNCVTCSAASTCLTCELGNYFNSSDSTCRTCSPSCAECSINGTCQSCFPGYYLSGTSCINCTSLGCLTCGSDLKCISCPPGYYLISASKLCDLCATQLSNCLTCSSSITCTQCAYGYALTVSGSNTICSTCSSLIGCFHCSNLATCLSCQSGYYLNGTVCSSCPEGCRNCDGTNCLSCGSSYFSGNILGGANTGKCIRCQFYLQGCSLCSNNTDCTNCQNGYYLDSSGANSICKLCQINIPSCSFCNSSTICTSCKGGYYLAANSLSCIQCSTTFSACRLCDRLGTACTDCQSSYYLNSGNCLLCSNNLPGCQICSSVGTTCIQCATGYYLNSPNCQLCSSAMPGCIFCSSSSVCLQCSSGYYLNSTFKCAPCSVTGCQVCLSSSPTQCVTCNSLYYKSSPSVCTICRSSIQGCLTCTDSNTCSKCDVGYFVNGSPPPQCSLCSSVMTGCSICSSSNTCLQCKSMYFKNSTSQCQICSQPLVGCTFCTNNTVCLSCGAGYFKNSSNLCQSCTDLPGCLVCKDSATCLFCDTGFYFSTYTCQPCTIMTGCYSCISSTICTSCIGGYTLNSYSGCDVAQVQASNSKVTDLVLKTFYVNSTVLKHFLYSLGMPFTKSTKVNWQTNLNLFVNNVNGTKIPLTVLSAEWAKDNNYTLIIYTNNPMNLSSRTTKMPFARRLLSTLDLSDTKTGIQISDAAVKQILPLYQHTGSLAIDYKLDNPEFYASFTTNQYVSPFPYYAIGAAITAILVIKFGLKSLATVPRSTNQGNIIPHILAFKVGALLLFPTYVQYISYCSGFMYADFPWLNRFFGQKLSDSRDITPTPYTLFYDNMNLASMYLLALSIYLVLSFTVLLVYKALPKYECKILSFYNFLYNFFSFGMFFAGCASLQGAIKNPIQNINVNGTFYILGILLYFALVCQCIYKISQNKENNFWKLRVLVKATLLSFSHYSPVYLLASSVVVDLVLIAVQYQINPFASTYKKSWLFSNITCNLALVLLVFLPIIQLTMILVSVSLLFVIVSQAIMHYLQTRQNLIVNKLQGTQISKEYEQRNMWDLNLQDKQLKKQIGTKSSFYDKSKTSFMNSDDNMATMYVQKQKKTDLEETQIFNSKYKRQRNFKKARQQKNKQQNSDDIKIVKNSPYGADADNFSGNKEPNLTFMFEDYDDK